MTIKHLLGAVTLVLAVGACKKGGDKGAAAGGGDIDAFMKLDTDKAAAFAVGGEDCAAKAKSVGDWRKAHTAEYKAMKVKLDGQWKDGPPKDVKEKYGKQMAENKKAVMDAMISCSSDEAFGKMMDETKAE